MKNLQYIFILMAVVFASCEPMEDIYDNIDKKQPQLNIQEYKYTLDVKDYALMGKEDGQPGKYNNFSTSVPPDKFLPDFLAKKFATFDVNSTIKVSYNYYRGNLSYLNNILNAEEYELIKADYDALGGNIAKYDNFSSSNPPEKYMSKVLETKYPDEEEGKLIKVIYDFYDGSVSEIIDFYEFDGKEWGSLSGVEVCVLSDEDYISMGAPGKYKNFSSSVKPENYLPQYLSIKYPYAQEGQKIATIYKYYSGSTSTKADEYTKINGNWVKYETTVLKTDPYALGKNGWGFDPSVLYAMEKEDYQIVVDYVKSDISDTLLHESGNSEYYYGASSHYSNFDIREKSRYIDKFEEWEDAVSSGIANAFLPTKFPNAVTQYEGVDVYYIITFATYSGSNETFTMRFQCTKSAPSPEFTFIEIISKE